MILCLVFCTEMGCAAMATSKKTVEMACSVKAIEAFSVPTLAAPNRANKIKTFIRFAIKNRPPDTAVAQENFMIFLTTSSLDLFKIFKICIVNRASINTGNKIPKAIPMRALVGEGSKNVKHSMAAVVLAVVLQ